MGILTIICVDIKLINHIHKQLKMPYNKFCWLRNAKQLMLIHRAGLIPFIWTGHYYWIQFFFSIDPNQKLPTGIIQSSCPASFGSSLLIFHICWIKFTQNLINTPVALFYHIWLLTHFIFHFIIYCDRQYNTSVVSTVMLRHLLDLQSSTKGA